MAARARRRAPAPLGRPQERGAQGRSQGVWPGGRTSDEGAGRGGRRGCRTNMGSVNRVILVGNLGRDAELRYTPGGAAVAKFSIATTEMWNDKSGQRQERTEWHNVDLWGKQAESLSEY